MEKETNIYETGYLASPILPEDKVSDLVSFLRKEIESRGGLITVEENPRMIRLAYAIKKPRAGSFESAYFGWLKYVLNPEVLEELKAAIDKKSEILRSLTIIAGAENIPVKKPITRRPVKRTEGGEEGKDTTIKTEEVDKKIEELIKETE